MKLRKGECLVCLNVYTDVDADLIIDASPLLVRCEVCGEYRVTQEAIEDELSLKAPSSKWWTEIKRAALSHRLRNHRDVEMLAEVPMINSSVLEAIKSTGAMLPTPIEQAQNVIKVVGLYERETGKPLVDISPAFYAMIGSPNPVAAARICFNLIEEGVISGLPLQTSTSTSVKNLSLTLNGWREWQKFQEGRASSRCGIIAMKFQDKELDEFVDKVVKPAVENVPGYTLSRIDDDDVTRAGVIDNIMRDSIRSAAFVIADLTHGNNGAYWEAGFAEGLGKPVIYICRNDVWAKEQTHFDTNHCTTIPWETAEAKEFAKKLSATLRNSLKIV